MAYFFLDAESSQFKSPNMSRAEYDALLPTLVAMSDVQIAQLKEVYSPARYHYPAELGSYSEWWWRLQRMATDNWLGHCTVRRIARTLAGRSSVFVYLFDHAPKSKIPDLNLNAYDVPATGPRNV